MDPSCVVYDMDELELLSQYFSIGLFANGPDIEALQVVREQLRVMCLGFARPQRTSPGRPGLDVSAVQSASRGKPA